MVTIKIPLVLDGTAIVYPGNPAQWGNAKPISETELAGEYSGELYAQDGVTKLFDWTAYTWPKAQFPFVVTTLAFMDRFTQAEQIAIDLAGQGTTPQAAGARQYQKKVDRADFIQLDRPDLLQDLLALEAAGLLAPGRAEEVVGPPVCSMELTGETRAEYGLPAVPTQQELAQPGGKGWQSPEDIGK